MANKKNKVKFNICNVHYAPITVAEEGTVSFGTPVPMPGAVSISMDPTGEPESFYADGIEYYVINNNQGYDGDLELAMIPESFRTDILKEEQDANLDMFSLEMFENIAFIMAKHADPSIPDTPEEWLDNFNTFSIYQVLPQLIELWGLNVKTDVEAKKNFAQQSVK